MPGLRGRPCVLLVMIWRYDELGNGPPHFPRRYLSYYQDYNHCEEDIIPVLNIEQVVLSHVTTHILRRWNDPLNHPSHAC